ncbi:MurR/RpiR family transcriptional regulator [Egibacter rhizosphaerae]|uniref:MurR/RpiR family transcriptional regulator n=1 Tax=Egibacter rhizosphaerae TaxID=1670831 RepID=A0A411YD79_9ACTN|nr:MurR/RpiR family transcriptional regulator [Egibacter rhizosphaerae]QBI19155.1 MurR/RpiR family transcriptional regulator [Egibacter rhizosphaerae]
MPTDVPPRAPDPGELIARIRGLRGDLSTVEQRVADQLLADPAAASQRSITDLAGECGASETTIVRFCRRVGFDGYRRFRLALAAAAAQGTHPTDRDLGSDIGRDDPLRTVVKKVGASEVRAVEDTVAQLDTGTLEAVVAALVAAPRLEVFGVGASGLVAEDLQQKLHRIGRAAFVSRDPHAALTSAALLEPGDAAIGISHTGKTRDTIDPLRVAAQHGATTIAITNASRAPLARAAAHVLTTAAVETTFRSGAMSSRIAQLVVVDSLFVGVAQHTYEDTLAALSVTFEAVRDRREGGT